MSETKRLRETRDANARWRWCAPYFRSDEAAGFSSVSNWFIIPLLHDDGVGSRRPAREKHIVIETQKQPLGLFVDRPSGQWIVRDREGNFWVLPSVENAWDHRLPFHPMVESDLEPIPGHYKNLLGLPI